MGSGSDFRGDEGRPGRLRQGCPNGVSEARDGRWARRGAGRGLRRHAPARRPLERRKKAGRLPSVVLGLRPTGWEKRGVPGRDSRREPGRKDHPQRRAIEGVVRDTLQEFVGTWDVLIRPAQTDPWWIVLLEREGGDFRRTLLLDLSEQTPEAVGKAIEEALRSRLERHAWDSNGETLAFVSKANMPVVAIGRGSKGRSFTRGDLHSRASWVLDTKTPSPSPTTAENLAPKWSGTGGARRRWCERAQGEGGGPSPDSAADGSPRTARGREAEIWPSRSASS
jgi:hypothetical protein